MSSSNFAQKIHEKKEEFCAKFFSKKIDFSLCISYNKIIKRKENKTMARTKTRGWYTFSDGSQAWFNGLSAREKANEIRKHGQIVKFVPTN